MTTGTRFDFQKAYQRALLAAWGARGNEGSHRGVFWYGAPGTGKTHTAASFCAWLTTNRLNMADKDSPPRYRSIEVFQGNALELVAETQAAIGRNKEARSLWEMIQEVKQADIAFFDDLGREREDYGQSVMFTLLDAALASKAFVVVTANRDAKALAEYYRGDDGLRSRLSALLQQEWPVQLPNLRKPVQGYEPRVRRDLE
jgi:DNA replication protein DnaC